MTAKGTITRLLNKWRDGDQEALERLQSLVYEEILRIARSYSSGNWRIPGRMNAKTLVQETYVSLMKKQEIKYEDRKHFYRAAAMLMRRILADHARSRDSYKRGADIVHVSLEDWDGSEDSSLDLALSVDQALHKMSHLDAVAIKVVELRFFGGYTIAEAAEILDVPTITANRKWDFAKNWLALELGDKVL